MSIRTSALPWKMRSGKADGCIAIRPRSNSRRSSHATQSSACASRARSSSSDFRASRFCCPDRGRWRCLQMIVANDEATLRQQLAFTDSMIPERISADPEIVENGLAKLVLSIIELIRRLLEKQALRRMDAGNLSDDEIEKLGTALMKLEEKMNELKRTFGLSDDDLNLKLGPVKMWGNWSCCWDILPGHADGAAPAARIGRHPRQNSRQGAGRRRRHQSLSRQCRASDHPAAPRDLLHR